MIAYLRSQFRRRPGRAATLGAGILVAAVSFCLLTAAAQVSAARLQGTVAEKFRTSYDLLVRPTGTTTASERAGGLVRSNGESGIFGGIRTQQWKAIVNLPGVEVAAPVQYLGYILAEVSVEFPLGEVLQRRGGPRLYRVRTISVADRGLSRYPGPVDYLYLADSPDACEELYISDPTTTSPYTVTGPRNQSLVCVAPPARGLPVPVRELRIHAVAYLPLLMAAVDPVQEDKLLDLDKAVLGSGGLARGAGFERTRFGPTIPVLASSRTYVDERLELSVERVEVPAGEDPERRLRDPAELSLTPNAAYRWARGLESHPIETLSVDAARVHQRLLRDMAIPDQYGFTTSFNGYWSASLPRLADSDAGGVIPAQVRQQDDREVWTDPAGGGGDGDWARVPTDNRDVQFRRLTAHPSVPNPMQVGNGELRLVGRFDPGRLPGFDPLNRVPLETYFPPELVGADAGSVAALDGEPLGPSANIGGYVASPPALLTTLEAAEGLTSPRFFTGGNHRAPISVVRVRVAGVVGPDEESLARIERVATLIAERTGLEVDVTAGSSPAPQEVVLAAGEFGRPELRLSEGWAKKGVSLVILAAVDRKSVLLLGLVLVVTAGFLGNATLASVRTRRTEIGALLSLGWGRGHILAAVLGEVAVVGLAAGLVGAGLAAGLVAAFDLGVPAARVGLIPVVALGLAVLAGAIPAVLAARGRPVDVVNPAVSGRTGGRATRHLPALAWVNLRRRPGRALVAGGGLFIGVGALAALIAINLAFQGSLAGTLLGEFVTVQARAVDYISVGLAIGLAGLSLADVLVLNIRERAAELATLTATGWRDRHLAGLTVLEALAIGVAASLAGAAAGTALGLALGGPPAPVLTAAALAAAAGLAVTAVATIAPLTLTLRGHPTTTLTTE